jgi:hypothetical protein
MFNKMISVPNLKPADDALLATIAKFEQHMSEVVVPEIVTKNKQSERNSVEVRKLILF